MGGYLPSVNFRANKTLFHIFVCINRQSYLTVVSKYQHNNLKITALYATAVCITYLHGYFHNLAVF